MPGSANDLSGVFGVSENGAVRQRLTLSESEREKGRMGVGGFSDPQWKKQHLTLNLLIYNY